MKTQTWFFAYRVVVLGFAALHAVIFAVPLSAQNCPANNGVRTICKQIGNAYVVSVAAPVGASPDSQLVVYWHDNEWLIDMLQQFASDGAVRMKITPRRGDSKIIDFPNYFAQVNSIARNPEDKAIILAEATGTVEAFLIADLKEGKLIDNIAMEYPSISPDRRFILYNNGYPAHGPGQAAQYHLYDTLKTPRENTCGYRLNDPQHKDLDESYRGIQVYPRKGDSVSCSDAELKAFEDDDHSMVSNFIWSADSRKAVFADLMNGNSISLILVTMHPEDKDREHEVDHDKNNDLPQTLTYQFSGAENVCAGAANCDSNNVRSIAWDGDKVKVALVQANPSGPAIVKNLTIPLSKFVPLAK